MKHTIKTHKTSKVLRLLAATSILVGSIVSMNAPVHAVGLRDSATIKDTSITLGDIFYDLPRDEGKVLGPAPRPGKEMVLNARTLLRIALALDLNWRPSSNADFIVIDRTATIVSNEDIRDVLVTGLKEKGVKGKFTLKLPDHMTDIILPDDIEPSVEIMDLKLQVTKNRFDATLVAPSLDRPIKRVRVTGTIEKLASIPVLRESLRNGQIIGQRDIELIDIPQKQLKSELMFTAEELIGMTPRRMISAGEPVRVTDIEQPRIVERGQSITMVFENGGLLLTARGRALENGTKGDIIRVVNLASNRTIDATVTGEQQVKVTTF